MGDGTLDSGLFEEGMVGGVRKRQERAAERLAAESGVGDDARPRRGSRRTPRITSDCPRLIGHRVEFLRSITSVVVTLAVAGCAQLTQLSNDGGVVGRLFSPSATDVEPVRPVTQAEAAPRAAPVSEPAPAYTDRARDHFFTLAWRTDLTPSGRLVSGVLENREGPALAEVTLVVSERGANLSLLHTWSFTLHSGLQKRETRPFALSLPSSPQGSQTVVAVWSYRFDAPSGAK